MKRVNKKKYKRKVVALTIITIPLFVVFLFTFSYWIEGIKCTSETNKLKDKLNEELEKEELKRSRILQLQDPEYIAKYAREKYLYSKDGEIIIRIED